MQLPENPILRVFAVIFATIIGVIGLGYVGRYVGVIVLLIAVSLPNGTELHSLGPERTTTTDIYLRNRTAAPMRVVLTVPRSALQPDSVWWPVAISPEAVGQALALHDSLVAQGLHYPLLAPLLLPGTADTLIDANFDESLPRALIHHKRYNNRPSTHEHTHRHFISPPESGQAVGLRSVPGAPDSLHLVLALAPGDSLRIARRRVNYFLNETGMLLAMDGEEAPYSPPYSPLDAAPPRQQPYDGPPPYCPPTVRVQWIDAQGRVRQQRPPLGALLRLPDAGVTLPTVGHRLVRRYWDYR